jgi:hypothetical protein
VTCNDCNLQDRQDLRDQQTPPNSRVITRRDRRSPSDGLIVRVNRSGQAPPQNSHESVRPHPDLRHRSLRRKVVRAMSWLIIIAATLAIPDTADGYTAAPRPRHAKRDPGRPSRYVEPASWF